MLKKQKIWYLIAFGASQKLNRPLYVSHYFSTYCCNKQTHPHKSRYSHASGNNKIRKDAIWQLGRAHKITSSGRGIKLLQVSTEQRKYANILIECIRKFRADRAFVNLRLGMLPVTSCTKCLFHFEVTQHVWINYEICWMQYNCRGAFSPGAMFVHRLAPFLGFLRLGRVKCEVMQILHLVGFT